uniref:Uncharacterized protein n=1 Tax=Arundo donax TaxID=35708 RepID=A0A0A9ETB0_ARUDO
MAGCGGADELALALVCRCRSRRRRSGLGFLAARHAVAESLPQSVRGGSAAGVDEPASRRRRVQEEWLARAVRLRHPLSGDVGSGLRREEVVRRRRLRTRSGWIHRKESRIWRNPRLPPLPAPGQGGVAGWVWRRRQRCDGSGRGHTRARRRRRPRRGCPRGLASSLVVVLHQRHRRGRPCAHGMRRGGLLHRHLV